MERTTYFWAFIATSFAGYFAIFTSEKISDKEQYLFLIESIGFIFSLGWFFVNRASKHWQLNWEKIIDSLEDDITGSLMKTHIVNHNRFWQLTLSYRFSVSRINQIISIYITVIWLILMFLTSFDIMKNYKFSCNGSWLYPITLITVIFFTFVLYHYGRSKNNEKVELKQIINSN